MTEKEKEVTPPEYVNELYIVPPQDKPFILALIASGMTVLFGVLSTLSVSKIDPNTAHEVFSATLTLTGTAWGYYFSNKASKDKDDALKAK